VYQTIKLTSIFGWKSTTLLVQSLLLELPHNIQQHGAHSAE